MAEKLIPLSRGQLVKLEIGSLAAGGEGVSKSELVPIFVNRVVPGDVVEAELFDVRKGFAKAKVVSILSPSEHRTEPPCPLFKVCGGCQWQNMTYDYQLDAKRDIVLQSLHHIGGLHDVEVLSTIASPLSLNYRNKAQFPVKNPKKSARILAGYYKQDSHELVNIKHCPVQPEEMDYVLDLVKQVWEAYNLSAYDEQTHSGLLRHINLRYSFESKQILVVLVLNCLALTREEFEKRPFYPDAMAAAKELMRSGNGVVAGVSFNCNSQRGNKILGVYTYPATGETRLEEVLRTTREDLPIELRNGLKFSLSATSFFQVNTLQAVRLLELVYDAVKGAGLEKPVVIDAYAGVGAISLWLAPLAAKVIAMEEHPAAVEDGERNATLNGIANVEFQLGAVEDLLPQFGSVQADVIVVDPPRKGVSPEVLAAIIEARPRRIVYVSCNPATLARDLKLIEQMRLPSGEQGDIDSQVGYKIMQVQPIDLFPQTFHVESVTVLERFSQ